MKVFVIFPVNFSEIQQFTPPELWSCVYKYTYIVNIQKLKYALHHLASLHGQRLIMVQVLFSYPISISHFSLNISCIELDQFKLICRNFSLASLFFIIRVIICVAISYVISFNRYALNLFSC